MNELMASDKNESKYFVVAIETYRRRNIGTILRCCVAFGCKAIFVIGSDKYSTHGAHGAQKYIKVIHFFYWEQFKQYATSLGLEIIGILDSDSVSISSPVEKGEHFNSSVAFIVGGKEGLNDIQKSVCSKFIHPSFPDSLSVQLLGMLTYEAKISICLHQFAVTCHYVAGHIAGEKFSFPSKPLEDTKPKSIAGFSSSVEDSNCENVSQDAVMDDESDYGLTMLMS